MLIEPLLWSHDILGIVNSFFFSLILWTRLSLSPFNRQGNWGTEKLRNLSRSQSGMSGRARFCSQAPALRICGSKSVTSHWPVIHFPPLSVHRPIYSNFVLMSWKQSADVPQGFHSSSKTWVVVFSFSFFKDFLRAISKFIKTFTVRVCTSFILLTFPAGFYGLISLKWPPTWLVGLCHTFTFLGNGGSSPVQPHSPASPLGTAFHFPLFSPVSPLRGRSEGLPWVQQVAFLFTRQSLGWSIFQPAPLQSLGVPWSDPLPSVSLPKPMWGRWNQTPLTALPAIASVLSASPVLFRTWNS